MQAWWPVGRNVRPSTAPPSLAERLLARALPGRISDACVLGDLAEEHYAVAAARGPRAARRWYWRQALALAAHAASERCAGALRRRRVPSPSQTPFPSRRGDSFMEALWRDLCLAVRALVRQPAFALTAIVTLAVGLAANAAIFALLDAIVLRPLTFRDVDRLVQVFGSAPKKDAFSNLSHVSPADFVDWRQETRVAESLAAVQWWDATITATREPERVQGFRVSPVFFAMLGVDVTQGRAFLTEEGERGRDRVAVLGHALWVRKYARDPTIVGRTISLDGEPYTVVGVGPDRFDFPMGAEVWTPLSFTAEQLRARDRRYLRVMGRLADGRTVADLQAELATISRRLASEYPDSNRGWSVNAMTLNKAVVGIGNGPILATWQVSAMLLLLVACVNVSCLLLVRGSARHKELALRVALGAGRWRIVRQLLIESVTLSLAGVVLALPLAWATLQVTKSAMPARIVRFIRGWEHIGIDLRLIAVMAACAVCASIVFGLLPALRATRVTLTDSLKEGGRASGSAGRQRLQSAMVLVEVAVALTLLVAAGLSVRGSIAMLTRSPGYDADSVLTMRIALPETKYREPLARRQFFEQLAERAATRPGVEQAALVNMMPSNSDNTARQVEIDGKPVSGPEERRTPDFRVITPNYFETMRIRLLSGRAFDERDRDGALPVAIISRTMARRYWNGEDPIGRRLRIGRDPAWVTVVGVVDDVQHTWFMNYLEPTFYVPLPQSGPEEMALALRGDADPASLAQAGRAAVLSIDPDQPVYDVATMKQLRAEDTLGLRYAAGFMGGFGLVALVLAAVGVYGVMAYAVSERTHEIGVRMALGASRRDVLKSTVGRGLIVTGVGLIVGLGGAYALGRVMESTLFGSVQMDLLSFIVFPALLAFAALVASSVPARRAMRVDPIVALRGQ
jgi:putative ABC transport system permease protein